MSETGEPGKIKLNCPGCGAKYAVKADLAGRAFTCKKCQTRVTIPTPVTPDIINDDDADIRMPDDAPAAQAKGPKFESRHAAIYEQGAQSLKGKLAHVKEKGQELLTGKKGYSFGEGTMRIMRSEIMAGADARDALALALEAERKSTGKANPIKETLVDGFRVDDYGLLFAGDRICTFKARPAQLDNGRFELILAETMPHMVELASRYHGLDLEDPNVSECIRSLDFRVGRTLRLIFASTKLKLPSALYAMLEMEPNPKDKTIRCLLEPRDHAED